MVHDANITIDDADGLFCSSGVFAALFSVPQSFTIDVLCKKGLLLSGKMGYPARVVKDYLY